MEKSNTLLNEEWCKELNNVENSLLYRVLETHTKSYTDKLLTGCYVPHESKNVFSSFNMCPWDDLKLVIIGKPVSYPKSSTGLCLGLSDKNGLKSVNSINFEKILKKVFNDDSFKLKDKTFAKVAEQGVLFIPAQLTVSVEKGKEFTTEALQKLWFKFVRKALNIISNKKENLVFLFLTTENVKLMSAVMNKAPNFGNRNVMYLLPGDLDSPTYNLELRDANILRSTLDYVNKNNKNDKIIW